MVGQSRFKQRFLDGMTHPDTPPEPEPNRPASFNDPRRWAVRLSFPLVAIGVIWAITLTREPGTDLLDWLGVAAVMVAGIALLSYGRRGVK